MSWLAAPSWGLFTAGTDDAGCHRCFSMSSGSLSLVTGSVMDLHTPQGRRQTDRRERG